MRRHVPWHVRSALVTVFRDLCVARSGAGSRNTFTWSRLGRAVGATRDLNAQRLRPAIPHYVTIIITRRTPGGVAPRGPDPGRMRARRPRARPRRGRDVERSRRVLGVHAGDTLSLYTRARNRGVAIGHSAGTTSVITSVITDPKLNRI